jgi:hypothetical protein
MKKILLGLIGGITALVIVGYVFRGPLMESAKEKITKDMFIAADADGFDAGLPIGTNFPQINALYQGEVVSDMGQFIGDRGMVFIANRSVDW